MSEKKIDGCKVPVNILGPDVEGVRVWTSGPCGRPCVAKDHCSKHYQQARRGRLGKTKTISAPGEADEVKVTLGKASKSAAAKRARKAKVSLSEWCRKAIEEKIQSEG